MNFRKVTTTLLLAVLHFGCASSHYPLRLHDWSERQELEGSDLIVLGTTEKVEWQPSRLHVNWALRPGISRARLVKLTLRVEQVIRGKLDDRTVIVFYWAADEFTNAGSLNLPILRQRSIHYLSRQDDVFRYVTDLVHGTTPVFSGAHPGSLSGEGNRDASRIAAILLTPGENLTNSFASNLPTAAAEALKLQGFVATTPLLHSLLNSSDFEVRWRACIALYEGAFVGQDDCLSTASVFSRQPQFEVLHAKWAGANAQFQRVFLSDPIKTAEGYAILPGEEGIRDFLGLVAEHPDPALASKAKAELQRLANAHSG